MIARIDTSNQHQIEYCTRWGNAQAAAYGLHLTGKALWVVGFTGDADLTSYDLPNPGGANVHHASGIAGVESGQGDDGFILRFTRPDFNLQYGTLIGGNRTDVLLDMNAYDDRRVFITGETRSASGFGVDLNQDYYFQDGYGQWNSRDALILCLQDNNTPGVLWRTPFGGTRSDRGWGIAASSSEVYLVGATASNAAEQFPLQDFNPASPLDLFVDWNQGGETSSWFVPFHQFCASMNYSYAGFGWPEPLTTPHDGFIASFGMLDPSVSMEEPWPAGGLGGLSVTPLPDAHWMVHLPDGGTWQLAVCDAQGRQLALTSAAGSQGMVHLPTASTGLYLLRATDAHGRILTAKIIKP